MHGSQRRSETEYPGIDLAGSLKMAWERGWFDEFSDEHFLVKAIEGRLKDYPQLYNLPPSFVPLYPATRESFQENFCVNLSAKLLHLIKLFGEKKIKRFIEDQLSAGKYDYSEDQFFRALSEISILSFYAMNAKSGDYEPKTNGKKNPEARFVLNNGVTIDIEVKTPGFEDFKSIEDIVIPTVLLIDKGRDDFLAYCKAHNLNGHMPRVMKLKDFLNNAVEKFECVDHVHHMNLLYINWSYSEFEEIGFQEAFSLLANNINGILTHKDIGCNLGINEEVYEKITVVIVYTESLHGLMFGDFRWVWIRGADGQPHFGIIGMHDSGDIFEVTGMNPYAEQFTPIMTGNLRDSSHANELMKIIGEHILKP